MNAWLPEAEGWVKLLGAFVAVLMAILVPVRSWIVEDRRDRDRMRAAARNAPPRGGGEDPAPPCLAREVAGLAEALRDCAGLLREFGSSAHLPARGPVSVLLRQDDEQHHGERRGDHQGPIPPRHSPADDEQGAQEGHDDDDLLQREPPDQTRPSIARSHRDRRVQRQFSDRR